jgi:hypothetical protein
MTDEHTPDSNDQDSPERRVENAAADFIHYVRGARNIDDRTGGGGITGITKKIVGFRRRGETVDSVDALARLFHAIGDLLELAQADRDDDSSDEAARGDQPTV